MPSEISQIEENVRWFYLYEISETGKMQGEGKYIISSQGLGEGRMGSNYLISFCLGLCKSGADSSDGCTTL